MKDEKQKKQKKQEKQNRKTEKQKNKKTKKRIQNRESRIENRESAYSQTVKFQLNPKKPQIWLKPPSADHLPRFSVFRFSLSSINYGDRYRSRNN